MCYNYSIKRLIGFIIWLFLFILTLLEHQIASAAPLDYIWKSVIAGGGGFVPGIVYHPTEPGLVYARTDIGGAYRWDNSTSQWIPLNDMLTRNNSDYMGILSIGLDPNDADRIYLQCGKYTQAWAGNGAVLVSTDRGGSWDINPLIVKVGSNEDGRGAGERLQVDPNLGLILFMGTTTSGLGHSVDYGVSWTVVSSFSPSNVNFVLFDPSSSSPGNATQRIFVGTVNTDGQSLYFSDNGGATWSLVPGQPVNVMAIRGVIADTLLYLTFANYQGPNNATAGSVWKYGISSGVWTDISPSSGSYGFSGLSVYPSNPNMIIVSTLDRWSPQDEVYLSTDGGTIWESRLSNAILDHSYAPYTAGNIRPHWLATLEMDPFDSNKAMFGTGYGIWACNDLTASTPTWFFRDENLEETVAMQIVSPPFTNLLSVMGDYDGFKHDDLDVSPPDRYYPYKWTTLSIAFAGKVPSKIVKSYNSSPFGSYSTDGGETWHDFASYPSGTNGGGSWAITISADGSTIVWSPNGASMSYSTDHGMNWTVCGGGVPLVPPVADRINPDKLYAFDSVNGRMWVSTDGGRTFSQGAGGFPVVPSWSSQEGNVTAVPGREGDLWFCCSGGGLYRSMNSGENKTKINTVKEAYRLGFGRPLYAGDFPAIYLYGILTSKIGFFRSDDMGETWSRINDNDHQYGWIHQITGDPRVYGRCYVSAEGRGILYGEPETGVTNTNPSTFTFQSIPNDSLRYPYQNITIFWLKATDPQSIPLTYIIHFFGAGVDTTFITTDTTATFSTGNIQSLSTYVLTGYVTNGIDTTASSNSISCHAASIFTDVNTTTAVVPDQYVLYQNYPNPFNPYTRITYSIQKDENVSIQIYNISGQLIRTLVDNQKQSAGEHHVLWDGRNNRNYLVSNGVYFCRMKTGDYTRTLKMVLEK